MITPEQRRAHRVFHDHLRKERGPASAQTCVDCGGPAKEWSWNGGSLEDYGSKTFVDDFDQYEPRCQPCHRRKDGTGFTHSPETREKMRVAKLGTHQSPEHRANISAALKGKTYSEERKKNMSEGRKRAQERREQDDY